MSRLRRTSSAALAVVLLLGPTACSGDDEPSVKPSMTASSTEGDAGGQERYAVELALVDEPEPPSGAPASPSATGSPAAEPPSEGPLRLTVTNTGKRRDQYLLRLLPPDAGGVSPAGVELAPGESTVVHVAVARHPGGAPGPLEVVAYSRAEGEVLATLELPGS